MIVGTDVLTVLSNCKIDGNRLVLPEQLERKLYERTNKVLVAAGGKWTSKVKAHVFAEDPVEVIDRTILTGSIVSAKDEFGFFPSPPEVVAELIERAQLQRHHRVLEPSAGLGAIALELVKLCDVVDCIEILPRNVAALRKAGLLVVEGDFLEAATGPLPPYDRVVMNPPFAKQADIQHVLHALRCLKPGGRLVAVMAAGVTFRGDKLATKFRALVDDMGSMEPLPDGSFKTSGTNVSTVVVTLTVPR